ncbi:hypothetical protein JVT61DRAFT_6098 [Boletus reticuloceps]|uniref:Uncharacterized protein n=1 Tax=Boletus reticuloceps TaxID=495285 RepID=A0A8I3A6Y4_9AGAM|nr:hypothetical protein JVT61DRAFT_6098 [Boletus reticuloceps]
MTLTCETFEGNPRIITATRDPRVQLWALDSKYHLSNIFSVELKSTAPRASCFCGGDVMIFGMYDGEICTLRSEDSMVLGTHTTGRMIGGAAVDQTRTYVVIDNAVAGYSLHRIDDGTCTQTYDTKPLRTYPKQVAFAEHGEKIVGGGEDGKTYQGRTFHLIATASSSEHDPKIIIWKKRILSPKQEQHIISSRSIIMVLTQIIIHLLAISMVPVIASQTIWGSQAVDMKSLWNNYKTSQNFDAGDKDKIHVRSMSQEALWQATSSHKVEDAVQQTSEKEPWPEVGGMGKEGVRGADPKAVRIGEESIQGPLVMGTEKETGLVVI